MRLVKIAKKATAYVLSAAMVFGMIPGMGLPEITAYADNGTGEEAEPLEKWSDWGNYDVSWFKGDEGTYTLYTAEELAGFAYLVNVNGYHFENSTIKLANNIDLSGKYWDAIGSYDYPFLGSFDGQGHVISGMTIVLMNISQYGMHDTGLFGYIGSGTEVSSSPIYNTHKICNIGIENFSIEGDAIYNAGGLAGTVRNANIYNCYSVGSIDDGDREGGLIGYAYAANINNCYSVADINFATTNTSYKGGFIGKAECTLLASCYSAGTNSGERTLFVGDIDAAAFRNCVYFDSQEDVVAPDCVPGVGGYWSMDGILTRYSTREAGGIDTQAELVEWLNSSLDRTDTEFSGMLPSVQECRGSVAANLTPYIAGTTTPKFTTKQLYYPESWTDEGNYDTSWYSNTNKVYYISNAAELAGVAYLSNATDETFEGCTIYLDSDIDLEGKDWKPISNYCGNFDGQNHVIKNLKIDGHYYSYSETGLFGAVYSSDDEYMPASRISNIGIVNADVYGKKASGILVGEAEGVQILNCYTTGKIENGVKIGGLIGEVLSSDVRNCYSLATVLDSYDYVGGLVGYLYMTNIQNSYYAGEMEIYERRGLFVGELSNSGSLNCYYDDINNTEVEGSYGVGAYYSLQAAPVAMSNLKTPLGSTLCSALNDFSMITFYDDMPKITTEMLCKYKLTAGSVYPIFGNEVAKKVQTITGTTTYNKIYGNGQFTLNAKTNGDGMLTYVSSDSSVASVDTKGKVTIKKAGKAVITVSAPETEIYTAASLKITINVSKRSISGAKVSISSSTYAYTGSNINPAATFTLSGKKLVNGRDYKVKFSNNENIGTATLTVTAIGNYTGTAKTTFTIIPRTIRAIILRASRTTVTLDWKITFGDITGYIVYRYNTKTRKYDKIKVINNPMTHTFTDTKLKSGKNYSYKVSAYKMVNNKKIEGKHSTLLRACTAPNAIKPSTSVKKKSVKLSWKKTSGATGYKVYYKKSNSSKWTLLRTTASAGYTKSGLKAGTYYFRVDSYRKTGSCVATTTGGNKKVVIK